MRVVEQNETIQKSNFIKSEFAMMFITWYSWRSPCPTPVSVGSCVTAQGAAEGFTTFEGMALANQGADQEMVVKSEPETFSLTT